ncbi:large ribosomal subunit protein uL13m-like [Apostichopus japonicus]|uniref:large ribosomal subunit protein uL13m-like n=1 Tax=Stichopus japonicus TaxID=307972 RepID=UPI003AB647AB
MSSKVTQQWATFARIWYILNADRQAVGRLAGVICPILQGNHKPIYHPSSDCGDHVVVYNTRHIAMDGEDWVRKKYYHHTGYPKGFSATPAYEVHANDPTKLVYKAVYGMMPKDLRRGTIMTRLHLFPDDVIPKEILDNISEQIKPPVDIPKRLDEYTDEERAAFPRLFVPKELET